MKSFKLISLQIVTENLNLIDIALTDGLIINKENDARSWLLEAFVEEKHFKELEPSLPDIDGEVYIQAVITKKENEPALFQTVLRTIRKVGNHYSLLFVGHIQKTRSKYAELLLEDLVQKGLVGDELIKEFKQKIRSKPKLATNK
ncbi:YwpF family protein [Peribacillus frigoritolerans]|uniref:YwpF family protein n=1 Tax=Peribacillus frigoritolerans TaxID=450367 RepID=UPI002E24F691|nr:YwpF family protein [Peribacillus frigoritolerans]